MSEQQSIDFEVMLTRSRMNVEQSRELIETATEIMYLCREILEQAGADEGRLPPFPTAIAFPRCPVSRS